MHKTAAMPHQTPESVIFHDFPDMSGDTPGITAVAGHGLAVPFTKHVHSTHVVGLVDDGTRVIELNGFETRIGPGRLFAIAAGSGHRCRSSRKAPHSYRAVCLPPALLAKHLPARTAAHPAFPSPMLDSPKAAAIINSFFSLLPPEPGTLARRMSLADSLAHELSAHAVPASHSHAEREAIRRVIDLVETDPAAGRALDELASHACLSPCHFQRVFTAQTGISPRQWVLACRIRHARALLDRGVPVAEAALRMGFADQSQFTKAFKGIMGIPPGRYLRHNPR